MTDDFVRDLEQELVAAARRRGRRRFSVPRPFIRAAFGAVVVLALVATLVALVRPGDDERAADERRPPPSPGVVVPLLPMLEPASCRRIDVSNEPSRGEVYDIGLLERPQRGDDTAVPPPQGNASRWLPVRSFDPAETRLARAEMVPVHVVPSLGVSTDGRCDSDAGPGLCLVLGEGNRYRCFSMVDVRAGRALTRIPSGILTGIVPDGIERVTLSAGGRTVDANVVDNVYQSELDVPAGTPVTVAPAWSGAGGCGRAVAPELLARVATLRQRPSDDDRLPRRALDVLSGWHWRLDAVLEERARYWGADGGVEFWVVPVVPRGGGAECAPARSTCVVAVASGGLADAMCNLADPPRATAWRIGPLFEDRAAIYGIVPHGVSRVRVTIAGETAEVGARDDVVGGVLPFPYRDGDDTRVEYLPG
jgi:hypothetical protein